LAIEEQYYFFLPALLVFCPRRYWMPAVLSILLTSLVLCLAISNRDLAFYMLPMRAWELMIGSFGALFALSPSMQKNIRLMFFPALLTVLTVPFIAFSTRHPGPVALLICVATLLLLLSNHPGLNQHAVTRTFGKLGDLSYSLYLVHWPLFAFFNNVWLGKTDHDEPLLPRIGLIMLSLLLAWLLHRYVEEPIRHTDIKRSARVLSRILITSLGIVLLNVGVAHAISEVRGPSLNRQANYGFSRSCVEGKSFTPRKECQNSEKPEMLVWGDSYAMHLIPILTSGNAPAAVIQATRPVCAPFVDTATVQEQAGYSRSWAQGCIAFNQSVLDYLKKNDAIKIVVLSSPIQYTLNPKNSLLRLTADGSYATVTPSVEAIGAAFKATIEAVHALGKRVVVVSPPPVNGLDVGRCHERMKYHLPILGATEDCSIDVATYHKIRADVLSLLDSLPVSSKASVIRLDARLCDEQRCLTELNGVSLYLDIGHLSSEGAAQMASYIALVSLIEKSAR